MPPTFYPGGSVKLRCQFKVDGVLTDPSTITLKVMGPDGVITTHTFAGGQVTKQATGIYYRNHVAPTEGQWYYRWEGTGTVITATEGFFIVKRSPFV